MLDFVKKISSKLSNSVSKTLYKAEEFSKGLVTGGTLFEELGFLLAQLMDMILKHWYLYWKILKIYQLKTYIPSLCN